MAFVLSRKFQQMTDCQQDRSIERHLAGGNGDEDFLNEAVLLARADTKSDLIRARVVRDFFVEYLVTNAVGELRDADQGLAE
jgi:hypothetical protein